MNPIAVHKRIVVSILLFIANFLYLLDDLNFAFKKALNATLIFFVLFLVFGSFRIDVSNDSFYYDLSSKILNSNSSVLSSSRVSPPMLNQISEFPAISARSFIAVDLTSNMILLEKNKDLKYPPASTTKVMTALIAQELYSKGDILEIPENCINIDAQRAGFIALEKIKYEDLISTLLISSAADSACALSISKVEYSEFINRMNSKARQIGMLNSNFTNPIGLDASDGAHYSSTYDLYLLAKELKEDSYLSKIVSIPTYKLTSGVFDRTVYNTNELLWNYPGTVGIKTGRTQAAKEVLMYEYSKDDIDILIVVMGSDDRFSDTKTILEWILNNYEF
mgnify:CR=1 FL=1